MILLYLIGLVVYALAAGVSYSSSFKQSPYYYWFGIASAVIANLIWFYIAKHTENKADLYIRALVWDSMIVGAYVIIPMLFMGVRLAGWSLVGAWLIIIGLILTKIA